MFDGQFFECADEHRLLFCGGWLRLSEILRAFGAIHPLSSSALSQSIRILDAQSLFGKPLNSMDHCFEDFRLDDEPPHCAQDSDLIFSPSLAYAQQPDFSLCDLDDLESKHTSNFLEGHAHLSNQDGLPHFLGLISESSGQNACTNAQLSSCSRQEFQQFPSESFSELQSSLEPDECIDRIALQAYQPLYVDAGNHIISVDYIGCHEVYDFTVDYYHNYVAAGLVHHNTIGAGYETTCHLTGLYPKWWKGRRFDKPVEWYAAGLTAKDTRDAIVKKLMGKADARGSGLIPRSCITRITSGRSIADSIDQAFIKHVSGGTSSINFKSFEAGREVFQAFEADGIWLDEEADTGIVEECITRLATTKGLLMLTFTPLYGLSEVVNQFIPNADFSNLIQEDASRYTVMAGWDDIPHLDKEDKDILLASYLPYQKLARSKGIPSMGSGLVYPVDVDSLIVTPFDIPEHFHKCYGFDVGWKRNAAIFGAIDRDADVLYLYHEVYLGEAEPSIVAEAITAPGDWIPGSIDPASKGRSQIDGRALLEMYQNYGLKIETANNSVEAGILQVWQYLATGRIKIFSNCQNMIRELRIYQRDEKGKIKKTNDHLCDALRYLIMSALSRACTKSVEKKETAAYYQSSDSWLGS
jgi:phage terminase large subunit-like protein